MTPLSNENIDNTINTSWNKAIVAPNPYCHFLNRIKMYKNINPHEIRIAHTAEVLISSAMVGPIFCEEIRFVFVNVSKPGAEAYKGLSPAYNFSIKTLSTFDEVSLIR